MRPMATPLHRMPYHVGVAARSFESAFATLGPLFGLEWEPPYHSEPRQFMSPSGPVAMVGAAAHSRGGPIRIEVCVGNMWPTNNIVEFHHYGYWSEDIARDTATLVELGWAIEVCAVDQDGTPVEFAYLTKADLARVELVDVGRHAAYCERVGVEVPTVA